MSAKRLPVVLVLALVVVAFTVRVVGNEWGFVRASSLEATGYPLDDSIDRSRVLGYYVHDEFSFVRFLDFTDHLRSTWNGVRGGEISWLGMPWAIYRGATVGDEMAATPFAAMVFSTIGTIATVAASVLGWGNADWWSLVTTTYRVGRWSTAALACLAMWPMAALLRRWGVAPLWRGVALALYALQVGNVATSHWMGYNPLTVAMHLAGFLGLLRVVERQRANQETRYRDGLALGAWWGLCLATKFTVLPLMVVTGVAMVVALWGEPNARIKRLGVAGVTTMGGALAVYLLLVGPNLLAGERFGFDEQRRMLVDESLGASSSFVGRLVEYFTVTLPVSFGWYPFLIGLGCWVVWAITWRRRSWEQRLLLLWAGLLVLGYTSNDLGLMPGRSLGVGALWAVVIGLGLDALARHRRRLAIALAVVSIAASAVAVVLVDRYFVNETDGYRTAASRALIEQVPAGSTLVLARDEKYHHTDLTLAERKLPAERHRYRLRFAAAHTLTPGALEGWALYWPDAVIPAAVQAELVGEFLPCCVGANESPTSRWLRRVAGQPPIDRLIFKAPGLRLYRLRSGVGFGADERQPIPGPTGEDRRLVGEAEGLARHLGENRPEVGGDR